jgi:O-antigen/teichoic acid export membrane protein
VSKRLSFRKNFLYTLAGSAVYCGCLWLMLMSMTKVLAVEEVGVFVLASAITTPIQMFTNLQLRAVQGSDVKNEYCFGEYFALRIITVFVLLVVSMIISVFLQKGTHMLQVMFAVVLYKCADSYADNAYGLLQKYERLDRVAISRITRGIIGSAVFMAILWPTKSLVLGFLGVSVAWAVIYILLDISLVRQFERPKPIFKMNRLVKLTAISLPLGVTMTIVSLNSGIPRYFTEKYLGSEQLGYFGALAYVVAMIRIAADAVCTSALPRLSRYYIENIRGYVKLLVKTVIIAVFIGLCGVLFGLIGGSRFIAIAYKSDYAEYSNLFVWLLAAAGVAYIGSMLCVGLTAARLFKAQVPLFIIVTLVTMLMSWILIPRFGILGAAWATLAGAATTTIGASIIITWNMMFHVNHKGVKNE